MDLLGSFVPFCYDYFLTSHTAVLSSLLKSPDGTNERVVLDDDEDDEEEEMFVEPHESFEFRGREWGGPRRGGRLPEPTRFGDWERKGRCTDF